MLKQSSKKIGSDKKRRKIQVLGTIDDFKTQKAQALKSSKEKPASQPPPNPIFSQPGAPKPAGQTQLNQLFMQPSQRSELSKDTEMKKK